MSWVVVPLCLDLLSSTYWTFCFPPSPLLRWHRWWTHSGVTHPTVQPVRISSPHHWTAHKLRSSTVHVLSPYSHFDQPIYHSVPHIRLPFCNLSALVESVGGAYMRDLTFYLAHTPPLPVPRVDVDTGTLYYRPIEAADLPSLLILSSPKPQKLDGKDRLTEVGHHVDSGIFQAFRGFSLSMWCCWLTPLANMLVIDGRRIP